jgi:hypothetical protein
MAFRFLGNLVFGGLSSTSRESHGSPGIVSSVVNAAARIPSLVVQETGCIANAFVDLNLQNLASNSQYSAWHNPYSCVPNQAAKRSCVSRQKIYDAASSVRLQAAPGYLGLLQASHYQFEHKTTDPAFKPPDCHSYPMGESFTAEQLSFFISMDHLLFDLTGRQDELRCISEFPSLDVVFRGDTIPSVVSLLNAENRSRYFELARSIIGQTSDWERVPILHRMIYLHFIHVGIKRGWGISGAAVVTLSNVVHAEPSPEAAVVLQLVQGSMKNHQPKLTALLLNSHFGLETLAWTPEMRGNLVVLLHEITDLYSGGRDVKHEVATDVMNYLGTELKKWTGVCPQPPATTTVGGLIMRCGRIRAYFNV